MKTKPAFWAVVAAGLLAAAIPNNTEARSFGTIRGVVKDGTGNPLVGAAVLVVIDSERPREEPKETGDQVERVIRRVTTDDGGSFVAAGIAPGRYRVKAQAQGFTPVELAAQVKANKVTVFDSILLRKSGTLSEEASSKPDPKYAVRSARGTVFHVKEVEPEHDSSTPPDRNREIHGFVQGYTQTGSEGSFLASSFAISQQVGDFAELVVSGQLGHGDGAPQRLQTFTTTPIGSRHRMGLALGYGRFTLSRRSAPHTISQISLSATDTWQFSGPVLVVYGVELGRFTEGASGTSILPRFGVSVDTGFRTRILGGVVPGSSVDQVSRVNLESGEIVFSEQKPALLNSQDDPIHDRSYRLEFGGEHFLSDNSSVQMMAFVDTVSGHGVGLLAIPIDRAGSEPVLESHELQGRSRGVRVVYRRQLTNAVEGVVGYAFGYGQRLSDQGLTSPGNLFVGDRFQVVSAKVDANFVSTGTKVSAVLRLAPSQAVFAIDPFQGQIATYDPNLSFLVTQELPTFGLLPGHMQAMLDVRNLLDQQASAGDDRQELIASRFQRLVRIGLSLRF